LISRFVSEKDNLAIVVFGSFRAGDDPHDENGLVLLTRSYHSA
jgi:hypothetical protein